MKKIISSLLALAMLATTLISCANVAASEIGNEINPTAEETSAEPTADDTSEEATDRNAAETLQDAELADLSMFEFHANRKFVNYIGWDCDSLAEMFSDKDCGYRMALCVVTALDIDLSEVPVEGEGTTCVKLTLKIDKILASTNAFDLNEGDTFYSSDSSRWAATDTGYSITVPVMDSVIPVTDCQYIVLLRDGPDWFVEDMQIDYSAVVLTLPITGPCRDANAIMEQCKYMDMDNRTAVLGIELVRYAFGEDYYPTSEAFNEYWSTVRNHHSYTEEVEDVDEVEDIEDAVD